MKSRPDFIYREERLNDKGEWVCVRMMYDEKLFRAIREGYEKFEAEFGEGSYPMGPYRYLTGSITWHEGDGPEPVAAKPDEPALVFSLPRRSGLVLVGEKSRAA